MTSERIKDSRGQFVPSVMAKPLTETTRTEVKSNKRRDEDALLVLMKNAPGGSIASMAEALGWLTGKGRPHKSRAYRTIERLKEDKLVTLKRGQY